jgi:hypothetical protein
MAVLRCGKAEEFASLAPLPDVRGGQLRVDARVDDIESGNERREHETPYPRRRPPSPRQSSCDYRGMPITTEAREQDHHDGC